MRHLLIVSGLIIFLFGACNGSVQEVGKPAGESASVQPLEGDSTTAPEPFGEGAGMPEETADTAAPAAAEKPVEKLEKPDMQKEAEKLRKELGKEYLCGIEGPFIVLGNITETSFKRIMRHTIRACSECMYKQYFNEKPDYILTIYLFGDEQSYRKMARKLWGDTDVSHFGYFKPDKKALVMNIGTGTGTLVHEMFHALVEPDFDDIPTWLNEGIASLYECCLVKDDGLYGMMNWRFPRLKEALAKDELVPLKGIVATSTRQFYGPGSDLHYAQARYFAMYLQELGKLPEFYKKFRDNYEDDPTGKKFLEELLDKEIDEIQKDWLDWVKKQKYER